MAAGVVGPPEPVLPMLASPGPPPTGPGWAFEFKWDGVRCVAAAGAGQVRLYSRNGNAVTGGYPELAALPGPAGGRPVLLDGEIVALDRTGRPDFGLLQQRMHVRSPGADLVARVPTTYYVFDVLDLDGGSLLGESYERRREVLADLELEGSSPRLRVPPHQADVAGPTLLEIAREHGLEGVVGKRLTSRYEPSRRSSAWIKTALLTTQEVVIGGWTAGAGRREGSLGALLLGAYDDAGALRYLGHVGTGFTEPVLRDLLVRLTALEQPRAPFDEPVPREHARRAHWTQPELVGEVEYRTLTRDRRLRHAAWRGLRPDREPREARMS
jgi:bifunctional non-homologous end joining protein LigD